MKKLTRENYGEFLKTVRLKHNLTQAELSERMSINKRTLEGWEQGRQAPKGLVEFYNFMKSLNK